MLRYRDARVNAQTKKVYRERLKRLGANFPIPDEAEEQRDPDGADLKIGAAMDEVRRLGLQGIGGFALFGLEDPQEFGRHSLQLFDSPRPLRPKS